MNNLIKSLSFSCLFTIVACAPSDDLSGVESDSKGRKSIPNNRPLDDSLGESTTFSTAGSIDMTNEFTTSYGTNGRHCGHCHKPAEGWTISAEGAQETFEDSDGRDPMFRTNDGSNSPDADVSTVDARRAAYSMLLSRGTIRVGIGIPAGAEFELVAVDDPYGHASAAELSLFRRPLPSANLTLVTVVMWDGRVPGVTVNAALSDQSNGATQGHAAATNPISQDIRDAIVGFETGLFNAQIKLHDCDLKAGRLDDDGARGGAQALATQAAVAGRFNLFDAWATSRNSTRRAVYRGQELFNTRTRTGLTSTCNTCHSTENSGTNFKGGFFNIGQAAGTRRASDQPLYTLQRISTGEVTTTTDPGRALITGKWTDIGKFKVPSLRALGARAPYFHGGSANTLTDVVHFYEEAMGFVFTADEEHDLVAFLSAL